MSWMRTFTGGRFYVSEPERSDFKIEDIAHALANICRFGGHSKRHYSVAEHSLLVSRIIKAEGGMPLQQLWGLMHDATEAYLGDIPTPLKATLVGYSEREDQLMRIIAKRLGLPDHGETTLLPKIVKIADRIALVTEARSIAHGTTDWGPDYDKVDSAQVYISSTDSGYYEELFLGRYQALMEQISKGDEYV